MELWAHTPGDHAPEKWQSLREHLEGVAGLAESFAGNFGAAELGRCLGLLHDLGKASPEFQDYLRKCHQARLAGTKLPARSVDHKSAGALYACKVSPAGGLLALASLGHHGGLMDKARVRSVLNDSDVTGRYQNIAGICDQLVRCDPPKELPHGHTATPESCEMFIRMLFSCLVDADYLDTECHWEPNKSKLRSPQTSISDLWDRFQHAQDSLLADARESKVNSIRREIYDACLISADLPQGVFRLTVPTGGGKTRSGMAFALKHAAKHSLARVVVAIPYTSIIDQNAQVYREIFGDENVLEHHSAVALPDDEEYVEHHLRMQLAAENWDAPIVVTTTVQLFESLFSNKPGRCRKLHNLARSVLILDEVQTLPVELVQPILEVLRELVESYSVTLVLSSATQPAFTGSSPYLTGFDSCTEIVPHPARYFQQLKRVEYRIEQDPWPWERVAQEMSDRSQVLCVLNSRKDALQLLDMLDDPNALHLSTLMCPAHRRDVLHEIRRRLAEGHPCRVVSTQVVECGCDLDFPYVMRALGPLDRIVQAAGRCNREGLHCGEVIVFAPAEGRAPRGNYETAMAEAKIALSYPDCDLHDPAVFDAYFSRLWQNCSTDARGICSLRRALDYPEVADKFKMIREDTVPVVVYYGDSGPSALLSEIKAKGFASREDWRALAPFTVSLFSNDFRKSRNSIIEVIEGLYAWTGHYDARSGISHELPDPADLIA